MLTEKKKVMKEEDVTRIIFRVLRTKQRKFAIKCIKLGVTQQSVLNKFIDGFTAVVKG